MVTISDVAARAGVGAGTVSRVLNGSPKVSQTTRQRVLATIEELGYRPNPLAQGLSRGRCRTLGVVIPYFTTPSPVERLRGVAAALDGRALAFGARLDERSILGSTVTLFAWAIAGALALLASGLYLAFRKGKSGA